MVNIDDTFADAEKAIRNRPKWMKDNSAIESAWLIELANSDGTVLAPAHYFGLDERGWTTDHYSAIRFCRKEDAERAIQLLRGFIYTGSSEKAIATEHSWDSGPRSTDN